MIEGKCNGCGRKINLSVEWVFCDTCHAKAQEKIINLEGDKERLVAEVAHMAEKIKTLSEEMRIKGLP